MNKYIVGLDGGGTKTLAVLYDEKGFELSRKIGKFSNFNINEAQAKRNLEILLDDLLQTVDKAKPLFIQMGISGYSGLKDKKQYENYLSTRYHAKVSIESDALIALYAIKKNESDQVILIIAGTGSVLMFSDQSKFEQIGGYGQLLGDEGSAYHLSISALKHILNEHENNKAYCPMSRAIMLAINASDNHDVKNFVYQHEKSEIAALSGHVISNLANQGDKDAIALYKAEAMALVKQAMAAYKKMDHPKTVIVGIRGSFIKENPLVSQIIVNELKRKISGFKLDDGQIETVKGAYYLALKRLVEV